MQNYWNSVKSVSRNFAENLTPVLKLSKFKETGNITPEEFVAAGDFLIEISPSWKWSGGDVNERKPFLPDDKQFLLTRRVPCYKRCKEIEYDNSSESIIKLESIVGPDADGDHNASNQVSTSKNNSNDNDTDWVDTHANTNPSGPGGSSNLEQGLDAMELKDENEINKTTSDDDDDSEEALDLEDIEDDMVMTVEQADKVLPNQVESAIMKTRTYDLHITYDKFYQTPRMWLSGYTENDQPLTNDQTYEDISQDHVNKTVTFEAHPHISGVQMCSIHPCKHANVIKKIMTAMEESLTGNTLQVHTYMIVFLKFIQAAIPTIEYDFTRHVKL